MLAIPLLSSPRQDGASEPRLGRHAPATPFSSGRTHRATRLGASTDSRRIGLATTFCGVVWLRGQRLEWFWIVRAVDRGRSCVDDENDSRRHHSEFSIIVIVIMLGSVQACRGGPLPRCEADHLGSATELDQFSSSSSSPSMSSSPRTPDPPPAHTRSAPGRSPGDGRTTT